MADKRLAWFKFNSRAWRANARLRLCSFAARGLWVDILSLMHESAHRGFLLVEGVVPTVKQLAQLLGGAEKDVKALLAELKATKVYSVTGEPMPEDVAAFVPSDMPKGVLVSRRMVRDEAKAQRDKANGKAGGNPDLKPRAADGVNPSDKAKRREERSEAPTGLRVSDQMSSPVAARGSLGGSAHDGQLPISIKRMQP